MNCPLIDDIFGEIDPRYLSLKCFISSSKLTIHSFNLSIPSLQIESTMIINESTYVIGFFVENEEYEIPANIERIAPCAFSQCKSVKKFIIPKSVVDFTGAFAYCNSVETIILKNNFDFIPEETFYHCNNLRRIEIESNTSVKRLYSKCFAFCPKLEVIPFSDLRNIDYGCFTGCTSLHYINLTNIIALPQKQHRYDFITIRLCSKNFLVVFQRIFYPLSIKSLYDWRKCFC